MSMEMMPQQPQEAPKKRSKFAVRNEAVASELSSEEHEQIEAKRERSAEKYGEKMSEAIYGSVADRTLHTSKKNPEKKRWIESAEPSLIAQGGEHLVFDLESKKHKGWVFKVDYTHAKASLKAFSLGSGTLRSLREQMERDAEEENKGRMILRKYFGRDAVPSQRVAVRDVPITFAIVEELDPNYTGYFPKRLPIPVSVQQRIELPEDRADIPTREKRVFSLSGTYPEVEYKYKSTEERIQYDVDYQDAYEALTNFDESLHLSDDERVERGLRVYSELSGLARRTRMDPKVREKLQETARELITFIRETGQMPDLNGTNNFALRESNGEWGLIITDWRIRAEKPTLDRLKEICLNHQALKESSEVNLALNPLNTVRVVNMLALISGIPDRLVVDELKLVPATYWRDHFEPLFIDQEASTLRNEQVSTPPPRPSSPDQPTFAEPSSRQQAS